MTLDADTLTTIQSLLWAAGHQSLRAVEFGSGLSTAILLAFAEQNGLGLALDSFDHDAPHAHPASTIRPLGEWDVETFASLLYGAIAPPGTCGQPTAGGFTAPRQFYQLTAEDFRHAPYHVAICDGAHGSGRSLAFPWLVGRLAPNALVLIDDYDHYPFERDFLRLFPTAILRFRRWTETARSVIYEVPG